MALSRLNLHAGRWFAFFGAGFLIVPSAIILFIYFGSNQDIPNYDDGNYTNRFDPNWLRKLWEFRRNEFSYMLAIDFFACMGLIFSLYSILCLKKILMFAPSFTKNVVVYSYLVGSLLPALEFLQNMGGLTEAYNISVEVKEDSALQALEVAYRVSEARSIWVFSLIYLFISLSIVTASFLFWTYQEFESKTHAVLGLFVGFIGIATLIVEVSWWFVDGLRMAFGLMTLFWGVVLVPGWLIFLGWRIGRFVSKGGHHRSRTGDDMTSSIGDIEMESNISI
ncbi:hypothetical protein QOT17_023655 [Balamuthia mandrillaris]